MICYCTANFISQVTTAAQKTSFVCSAMKSNAFVISVDLGLNFFSFTNLLVVALNYNVQQYWRASKLLVYSLTVKGVKAEKTTA